MICNIFSHSAGCLSTLLIMSFDEQKFLSFMLSGLSTFAFLACAFWCHIQEIIAKSNVMKPFLFVFFQEFYRFVCHQPKNLPVAQGLGLQWEARGHQRWLQQEHVGSRHQQQEQCGKEDGRWHLGTQAPAPTPRPTGYCGCHHSHAPPRFSFMCKSVTEWNSKSLSSSKHPLMG